MSELKMKWYVLRVQSCTKRLTQLVVTNAVYVHKGRSYCIHCVSMHVYIYIYMYIYMYIYIFIYICPCMSM